MLLCLGREWLAERRLTPGTLAEEIKGSSGIQPPGGHCFPSFCEGWSCLRELLCVSHKWAETVQKPLAGWRPLGVSSLKMYKGNPEWVIAVWTQPRPPEENMEQIRPERSHYFGSLEWKGLAGSWKRPRADKPPSGRGAAPQGDGAKMTHRGGSFWSVSLSAHSTTLSFLLTCLIIRH